MTTSPIVPSVDDAAVVARERSRRRAKLSRRKLQRTIEYIESHLREELTLRDIAGTLAMSPWHFAHAFKDTVGMPPHRYVMERKIESAKAMLRESDLPITDIAQRVGCASHSHFTGMFHRLTGESPREYRSRA